MQVLAEHVRRHERDALVGDSEAPGLVFFGVFADDGAGLDACPLVDNALTNPAVFTDIDDSRRDLGFSPSISLEQGIQRFVDWLREYQGA